MYSFDGNDTTSETSELQFLANLAGKSPTQLYRDVQELRARGIVQSRSVWRAVLPHAIANRLAKNALNSIPKPVLVNTFLSYGSDRLIQSFTRRLSYLHDCQTAVEIAQEWLQPDGWIGKTNCNFNALGLTIFKNLAPIVPEATLAMLERATSDQSDQVFTPEADRHRSEFVRLLRHLAYESDLFQRSVRLLCKCALLEDANTNNGGSARATLKTLFHIILSETHASLQVRASMVNELVNSNVQQEAELGITFLEAALQTHHFHAISTSNFGARSRDLGYWPKSHQEISDWYGKFIDICIHIALSDKPIALKAKRALANNLRGLWAIGANESYDLLKALENAVALIHEKQPWNEGWLSIKGVLRYDSKSMQQDAFSRLKQLETLLKPTNLLEQARTYALTNQWRAFALEDDFDEDENVSSHLEKVQNITRQIGAEVGEDIEAFNTLLPELVANYGERLGVFGAGLADGCEDRQKVWQMLYHQLEKTPPDKRQIAVLLGFLSSCADHDPGFYRSILDSLINDELLGQWFPHFQATLPVDEQGIERLHVALDSGKAHIGSFQWLGSGRHHKSIDDDSLAALIQKILTKEGGLNVASEILMMRFYRPGNETFIDYSPNLVAVACEVMSKYPYDEIQHGNNRPDYLLAKIASVCLNGNDGIELAKKICQTLANGFQEYRIAPFDYPYLLKYLAHLQPKTFLDVLIGADEIRFNRRSFDDLEREDNPINQIPENILIDWCEQAPEIRYPKIVSSMQTYSKQKEAEELQWKPIIYVLLEKSSNVQGILSRLSSSIHPMSWSGSYANTLEKRLVLFTVLFEYSNPTVRDWAKVQHGRLQQTIIKERENELKEHQARFERFE